jgi:lysine-specific demethylase 8
MILATFDPSQHPEATLTEIPRVERLSDDEFVRNYLRKHQPVVYSGGANQWPATKKWSFDFFRKQDSDFTVTLEEGNVMQEATTFRNISFRSYLDEIESPNRENGRVAYLSVFNIFQHFPDLADDVDFGMMSKKMLINHAAGWIGPGGTVTGYHIDRADNLLVQIVGRKFVKLVSPAQNKRMYPSAKYDSNTLMSSINADNYDRQKYPEFAKVNALQATIEPGDILFIPRGWWHYVRALDPSISVNNFGIDLKTIILDKPREYTKKYLHRLGLYGKECTCHMMVNGKRVAR